MNQFTIYQFVVFSTELSYETFLGNWVGFVNRFMRLGLQRVLLHRLLSPNFRFQYISKNSWDAEDFANAFPEGRVTGNIPSGMIRVTQAGAYLATSMELNQAARQDWSKVLAFCDKVVDVTVLDTDAKAYEFVNVYTALNSHSKYAQILEFFVAETKVEGFRSQLARLVPADAIGIFKEARIIEGEDGKASIPVAPAAPEPVAEPAAETAETPIDKESASEA